MFSLGPSRRARRPSLTPMIDVVFLLLVFFMLASRFGQDMALPVALSGTDAPYDGPPRLVGVAPDGLSLNGVTMDQGGLVTALQGLMATPADAILLRPSETTNVQRLVKVIEALNAAGFSTVVVVE
jgi:biopolymer transport protein ExbD